jgi:hypothetical protein
LRSESVVPSRALSPGERAEGLLSETAGKGRHRRCRLAVAGLGPAAEKPVAGRGHGLGVKRVGGHIRADGQHIGHRAQTGQPAGGRWCRRRHQLARPAVPYSSRPACRACPTPGRPRVVGLISLQPPLRAPCDGAVCGAERYLPGRRTADWSLATFAHPG